MTADEAINAAVAITAILVAGSAAWDASVTMRKMAQDERLSGLQDKKLDLLLQKEANRHTEAIVDSIVPDEEAGEDTL
jgi:hypothetical protein